MTFAEWRWSEHRGTKSAHQSFRELSNRPEAPFEWLWNPPPGDLGEPANLFASGIYLRAAMTLQALREDVGDPTFFRILSKWAQDNRYGNVYTVGFISLCEEESGRDLNAFFQGCFTSRANPRAGEFSVPSWVAPLDLRGVGGVERPGSATAVAKLTCGELAIWAAGGA